MKTWPILAALSCAATAMPAFAQDFAVGQHVKVGSTGDTGVIIWVGQKMRDGGTMVEVQLDRLPKSNPPSGVTYDTAMSRVEVIGGGGQGGGGGGAAPAPTPAY